MAEPSAARPERTGSDALKVLLMLETLGPQVMGHARVADALMAAADRDDISFRFLRLPPLTAPQQFLVNDVRILHRYDADLQQTRWHVVQAVRTARIVRDALDRDDADVVGCSSHAIALVLDRVVGDRPLVLFADTAMRDWRALGVWRPMRPWSDAVLAGSYALERRVLRRAALVVAWSEWTRDGLLRRAPEANVIVLHPGLDLAQYRPAERRTDRIRPRILFVGGRFAAKGGDDLLEAVGPMLGRDVDVEAVTPEEIPEREGLRRLTLSPGDELSERFRQADLVALPSYGEAVPWVVLEALASGTPVVATTVGAVPEMLLNGRVGALVPPGDRGALREAIAGLLSDQERRTEMGQLGRALCEDRYDARKQSVAIVERFQALVAGRAR